jgi:ATP-dependent Clp protease adaptor protein ClpS
MRTPVATRELTLERVETTTIEVEQYKLVLYNDEHNTFDWVIHCLIQICGHTPEQAEQCAMIVHHKGRYAVKRGTYDYLEPICVALLDRGLSTKIE